MNLHIPAPTTPVRDYTKNGIPVSPAAPFLAPLSFLGTLNSWASMLVTPDGVNTIAQIALAGGAVSITDADGEGTHEGDGIGAIGYFYMAPRRTAGSSGAIAAQTVALVIEPVFSCTANATTNEFTCANHRMRNGQTVVFSAVALPSGLTANTPYVVRDAALNTFKVAATVGGAAIDITTAGTSVTFTPGPVEVGRIQVPAVAAGDAEPQGSWFSYPCPSLEGRQFDSFELHFDVSDADLTIYVEIVGSN